jgi:hypothetical protein
MNLRRVHKDGAGPRFAEYCPLPGNCEAISPFIGRFSPSTLRSCQDFQQKRQSNEQIRSSNDVPMVPEPNRHSDSSEKIGKALASVVRNRANIA